MTNSSSAVIYLAENMTHAVPYPCTLLDSMFGCGYYLRRQASSKRVHCSMQQAASHQDAYDLPAIYAAAGYTHTHVLSQHLSASMCKAEGFGAEESPE